VTSVGLVTSVGPHLFWITSRATGTAALVLSSASVGAGLLIGARADPRKGLSTDAKALHEALALATLVAIAIHGATLLGDHYLHPTVFDISIPFTGGYRPFWTGIGITAGWGLAALGLSYYARSRVGQSRWRALHRFTAAFWVLGIAHSIGAGTDGGQLWFLLIVAAPAVPALILLLSRLARSNSRRPQESGSPRAQRSGASRPVAADPRRREPLLSGRES
jgi:methionine sulfoxide reductase heme-binding subunit